MCESFAMRGLRAWKSFRPPLLNDEGAGTVTALTVVATLVTFAGLLLPLVGLAVVQVRAQALSDRAALAAADAMTGAQVGLPCEVAADIVASMRADGWTCDLDSGDAFVTLRVPFGPIHVDVRSRAGLEN
jgi:secretion/DNA translocation related TadE-like protein